MSLSGAVIERPPDQIESEDRARINGRPAAPSAGRPLRVLVVAAYPAVRAGLASLLAQDPEIVALEAASVETGRPNRSIAADGESRLDVVVIDLAGVHPPQADDLAERFPEVPFVVLGADPEIIATGLGDEPVAYLAPDTDAPALAAAVRAVVQGLSVIDPSLLALAGLHAHSPAPSAAGEASDTLTAREHEVLRLVADGLPNKAIARELGISEHTAKFHVGSLLSKLGASSRTEAVTLATRRGLLAI